MLYFSNIFHFFFFLLFFCISFYLNFPSLFIKIWWKELIDRRIKNISKRKRNSSENSGNSCYIVSRTILWNRFVSIGSTDLLNSPWEPSANGDQIYSQLDPETCARFATKTHWSFASVFLWYSDLDFTDRLCSCN